MPGTVDDSDVMRWTGDSLRFLDQTVLPGETCIIETRSHLDVINAIRRLSIRGAPLIGIAAAYAVALAAQEYSGDDAAGFRTWMNAAIDALASSRPTAMNLFWALARMRRILESTDSPDTARMILAKAAVELHADDATRCAAIGGHGMEVIPRGAGILTHCNTGALATGGDGTAFAVILAAHRAGKRIHVYADETRPLLQGARLTMWELRQRGIPSTLITDGTAASLMRAGLIDIAITGADRIAANGDTANKIGTYALAVAAHHHGIPFYVAAPLSTIDPDLKDGGEIPIELRDGDEIAVVYGRRIAPDGIDVFAPAFDVTPANLISGIITERGIIAPPYAETLRGLVA